jgi:hypothetical protein
MSRTSDEPGSLSAGSADVVPPPAGARRPSTTLQGWAFFGAAVMGLLGFFQALMGLVALVDDEYFTLRSNTLLAIHSYAPWGWVHLIGGVAAVAAGLGILLTGHRWARLAGIVVAALSVVVNLGFLAASPVWSTLLIALDVIVIHALTVHGWELDDR